MRVSFRRIAFLNKYQLERTEAFLREADGILDRLDASFSEAVADAEVDESDEAREYVDHVANENGLLMDAVVGAALVVIQTFITAMKASCSGQSSALPWAKGNGWQVSVMTRGGSDRIVDLNGLANYFKHQDEWDTKWFASINPTPVDQKSKAAVDVAKKYNASNVGTVDLVEAMKILCPQKSSKKGYSLVELMSDLSTWQKTIEHDAEVAKIF